MPSAYTQSVDKRFPVECSLDKLKTAYEGAINFGGLGKPKTADYDNVLPCFGGAQTARSMRVLARQWLSGQEPVNKPASHPNPVPDPYDLIIGNAIDGTCVIAMTIQGLMKPKSEGGEGFDISQIKEPNAEEFDKIKKYMQGIAAFDGVTGRVKFNKNDLPNNLVVQQVQGDGWTEVGVVDMNDGTVTFTKELYTEAWQDEHIDPPPPKSEEFNFFVEVILPFFFVIIPILLLLALSPLLCLVVMFIFKSITGRMNSDGGGGDAQRT